ncbi:uncharacterized protein O3Q21_001102 [Podargus strigoides]
MAERGSRRLPVCWRSGAEDTVVRSCSGDAVVCTRLGLAWVVSARPGSPRGTGAKRERRSGSWLWPGAAVAAAGEAGEREGRRDRRLSGRQLPLHVRKDPSSKCAAGPTVNVHRRVEDSRATGAPQEEGRTEGERSVLPGERSEQRHERELRCHLSLGGYSLSIQTYSWTKSTYSNGKKYIATAYVISP